MFCCYRTRDCVLTELKKTIIILSMKKKKVIAVASLGGHWIQLLRIAKPLGQRYDITYMSTHEKCRTMVDGQKFYKISDFNRRNAWKMLAAVFKCLFVLLLVRPSAVVTTGAAPGLLVLILARLFCAKTIWIDSVANVKTLSACGHLARFFAKHVYTQWPDLASDNVDFVGNIFGDREEGER